MSRPAGDRAPSRYRVGDLLVDLRRVEVTRGGEVLELPGLTFDTLVCLLDAAPGVASHERLVDVVWQGAAISDETITQRISLLRRALGDAADEPRYVATVRGRGYRLVPAVTVPPEPAPVPVTARDARGRRRGLRVAFGALATSLLAACLLVALPGGRGDEAARGRAAEPTAAPPSATELTARGLVYLARHRDEDNELAIELFRHALQEARPAPAARLGLSLALSQRATKFNRPLGWAAEAEALARATLSAGTGSAGTESFGTESIRTGASAEAYHALGLALDAQGRVTPALAAYRRAVALDPHHAGAVASAAYLLAVRGELAEALHWDLRALHLEADTPYVELQIAEVLATLGYDAAAEAWYRRTLALRPDNLFAHGSYAAYLLARGHRAAAETVAAEAISRGIERPEPLLVRGHLAWLGGQKDAAAHFYRRAARLNPRLSAAGAYLAALLGPRRHRAAQHRSDGGRCRGAERPDGDEWPLAALADVVRCETAGDRAAALAALDRAIDLGYRDDAWLLVDPALASLRGDAGFDARVGRIRGLVTAERTVVEGASWIPAGVLSGSV